MELLNVYSFFTIRDPQRYGQECYLQARARNIKGTLLIAKEGINWALCGISTDLDAFLDAITQALQLKLDSNCIRRSVLRQAVFRKLKLKIKTELVTSHFDKYLTPQKFNANGKPINGKTMPNTVKHAMAANHCANYLSPAEFHKFAQQKDAMLLDMRNDYEYAIGSFRGALQLPLNEFHELPQHITQLEAYRSKTLLTFCTGGVRCEKAVPLLLQHGLRAYQLHGGILHYLEKYSQRVDSLWQGECFVFDDRVAVRPDLQDGSYQWCSDCGQPSRNGVCVICAQVRPPSS